MSSQKSFPDLRNSDTGEWAETLLDYDISICMTEIIFDKLPDEQSIAQLFADVFTVENTHNPDEGCLQFCGVTLDMLPDLPDDTLVVELITIPFLPANQPHSGSGAKKSSSLVEDEKKFKPSEALVWSADAMKPPLKKHASSSSSASSATATCEGPENRVSNHSRLRYPNARRWQPAHLLSRILHKTEFGS